MLQSKTRDPDRKKRVEALQLDSILNFSSCETGLLKESSHSEGTDIADGASGEGLRTSRPSP